MKDCRKCGANKEDGEFRPGRRVCKGCERAAGRAYRRVNPSTWANGNKERMKKLQADWYQSNKEKINEKFRQRYHDTQSDFRKIKNYRTAINHMLGGSQKSNRHLGCNRSELQEWCQHCFKGSMSFENYGEEWVTDHVIPLDFLNEHPGHFSLLATWWNIMPVSPSFNLSKNKRVDSKQIREHLQSLESFQKLPVDREYITLLAKHLDAGIPLES